MKREETWCAVIGGCVGAVLTLVVCSFSPLGTENEAADAEFGVITCQEIRVISSDGKIGAAMGIIEDGGIVSVNGNGGLCELWASMKMGVLSCCLTKTSTGL